MFRLCRCSENKRLGGMAGWQSKAMLLVGPGSKVPAVFQNWKPCKAELRYNIINAGIGKFLPSILDLWGLPYR